MTYEKSIKFRWKTSTIKQSINNTNHKLRLYNILNHIWINYN